MGQWIERVSDLVSVGPGVLVQPSLDRVAVYITNLSGATRHITPIQQQPTQLGGIAIPPQGVIAFQWALDGNLARCQWIVTDASGVEEWHVVESIYLEPGGFPDG